MIYIKYLGKDIIVYDQNYISSRKRSEDLREDIYDFILSRFPKYKIISILDQRVFRFKYYRFLVDNQIYDASYEINLCEDIWKIK